MLVWFGELGDNDGAARLAGNDKDSLLAHSKKLDSKGHDKNIDLIGSAIKTGLCNNKEEYRKLIHAISLEIFRSRVSKSLSGKDAYIIQAINSLDEVNSTYNLLTERIAEWYGIHFPEYSSRPQELINTIIKGTREASEDNKAMSSMGAPMSDDDIKALQSLALTTRALFDERKALEKYIMESAEEVSPNLSSVLGPLLAARMIARAGSLEKLSKMPASTIQVLGSGEALFSHLRSGSPPPKHGIIYQHPLISGSPKRIRGKVSRMIAGKAAIAARVDNYSGVTMNIGEGLKEKVSGIKSRSAGRKKK
jgi:nucleolar protein 56